MAAGMPARALGPLIGDRCRNGTIAVPFDITVATVAATSTYDIFVNDCPKGLRIIDVYGFAAAAGGAADTVQVQKGTTAITNAMDFNVADNTRVAATTLDDAQMLIPKGGSMRVVTASGAVARVHIKCVWTD